LRSSLSYCLRSKPFSLFCLSSWPSISGPVEAIISLLKLVTRMPLLSLEAYHTSSTPARGLSEMTGAVVFCPFAQGRDRGTLVRHQSQPGRKLPSFFESRAVPDGRYDRSRDHGPTPGICCNRTQLGSLLAICSSSVFRLSICICRPFHSCHRKSNRRRMAVLSFSSPVRGVDCSKQDISGFIQLQSQHRLAAEWPSPASRFLPHRAGAHERSIAPISVLGSGPNGSVPIKKTCGVYSSECLESQEGKPCQLLAFPVSPMASNAPKEAATISLQTPTWRTIGYGCLCGGCLVPTLPL